MINVIFSAECFIRKIVYIVSSNIDSTLSILFLLINSISLFSTAADTVSKYDFVPMPKLLVVCEQIDLILSFNNSSLVAIAPPAPRQPGDFVKSNEKHTASE